ncbi:hypothetical protein Gasu2_56410 [Galdieria sulphuraria]|uniref:Uncharacterized protein n=1 Tax=Galdieria sulphuraria TaxID=130081 RepID=M2XSH4_GALSU|nr:uncharacterized protein Gasu_60280 [Galdieria sulphuraria]EME26354.1 hypothetical protein Gasu_60280 [Galdieria sulphuraria]GJD11506.1 hypothetical protein Gasu2_56410 [Galdieria sulphuraria]|eukprot:XP_005702874.1 hypothetical protein Gasu_60280 [Galdieria sulphuraria]
MNECEEKEPHLERRLFSLNIGNQVTVPVLFLTTLEAQNISFEKVSSVVLTWSQSHLEALLNVDRSLVEAGVTCFQIDGFQVRLWVENEELGGYQGWFRSSDRIQVNPTSRKRLVVLAH